ncbi:alginate export family protein [Paraferrimonas sedimenticola]|uniref:Alginate export domain-containing protein n=2 Tax=Paraferrimonas sedimenticola TaxID=375674 RepID=A0AA37RX29_9GAMM|nr:alginate export family protein [Paraferrimonas sedimenticola]GLP96858.1 hypothetical protein GCM10007895_21640 [Paraferrimonas sedimenticola]
MLKPTIIAASIAISLAGISQANAEQANTLTQAITEGKASVDVRLRYEGVDQDNALKNANALTVRTRLGYTTADFNGFSALVEFEDSRPVAGVNKYNDALGSNPEYSVIADPKTTEVDQAFLQYKNDQFKARVGRQVIALDNQRFVGHVGWRQDRQTFDAVSFVYSPIKDLDATYAYIGKRNRIFSDVRDVDSKDHLFNLGYKTAIGKISGYGYLLAEDNNTKNNLDTFGIRLAGKRQLDAFGLGYQAEFAQQKSVKEAVEYKANYYLLEGKASFKPLTVTLGYEVLGSDNGNYGFATPLATLHKFNGWADQFLGTPKQGLKDLYLGLSGNIKGHNWGVTYHDFKADVSKDGVSNLGKELDVVLSRKLTDNLTAGVKYAAYMAGDSAAGKVDTNKLWVWTSLAF